MPSATITVQAKQSPAIGKKQGKIQDTNGDLWNVWGDKLQNYREGVTYDIVYEASEFNGHNFNVIKTANPSNGSQSTARIPAGGGTTLSPAPQQARDPIPPQPSAKDEMIFVCGILNNSLSNTNINPFEVTAIEMIAMVDKARQVWRNTLGKKPQSNDEDIRDSVPF